MSNKLNTVEAPSLPLGPEQYVRTYQDQYSSVLRLYFNRLSAAIKALLSPDSGGKYLYFPYGAIQDTTDQYASAANTATQVLFNTTDFISGMVHVPGDGLTASSDGIYNYQFSIQFANTDTQINEAEVWLKKKANGAVSSSNIAGTNSKFSIPNKHGSVDGYSVAALNFYLQLNSGDTVELWWQANAVANSTGTIKGIYIEHYAATGNVPATPSAVATLSFVSNVD